MSTEINLVLATENDAEVIHQMKYKAFLPLYEKSNANMKQKYPEYTNCIANLANSVLEEFGIKEEGRCSLKLLEPYLKKNYENIIVILLDGMGKCILDRKMLGDYLAIVVDDLSIYNLKEEAEFFIGVHAGMTEDEITIPLIIIENSGKL